MVLQGVQQEMDTHVADYSSHLKLLTAHVKKMDIEVANMKAKMLVMENLFDKSVD